jgi:pyruvate ferredoxin oxidoreductase delta subunit
MTKEIRMELVVGGWNTRTGQSETGSWRSFRPVVGEACTRCGICVQLCPEASIALGGSMAEVDYRYCKGCGICAYECPSKAIEMRAER